MRGVIAIGVLLALGLIFAAMALLSGPSNIGWAQVADGLDPVESQIIFQLRLPRVIMAILAGSALAVSGVLMQTFFRNPLAEPYITGVSAGGALGAVAAGAFGLAGVLVIGSAALTGGALVTAALYLFALRSNTRSPLSILLLGIALGTLCGALIWFILLRQGPGGTNEAIAWLLGRVSTVGYTEIVALLPAVVIGLALAVYYIPDLDALLLGEEKAASLGVDILAARRGILGAAALLAAACVAFCGVIAFVGLMVPHIARGFLGATHARLLPLSAVGGAVLLLGVDLVARTIDPPREIPLTVITSILGAPFFIVVLLRSKGLRW